MQIIGKHLFLSFYFLESLFDWISCQCSGSVENLSVGYSTETISPPGYPNGYAINMQCKWLISSVTGDTILFRVTDITLNCAGDAVNVYDGSSTSGTNIHSNECQSDSSPRYLSYRTASTGNLYATFVSDSSTSTSEKGFLIFAISGKDFSSTGCSSPVELTAADTEQYLTSPGFPDEYPTDKDCTWVITSQSDKNVNIALRFLHIEHGTNCQYDYLEIVDSGSSILKTCLEDSWNPSYNYTGSDNITVMFHSDDQINKRGFQVAYWQTERETTTERTTEASTTATGTTMSVQGAMSNTSDVQGSADPTNSKDRTVIIIVVVCVGGICVAIPVTVTVVYKHIKNKMKVKSDDSDITRKCNGYFSNNHAQVDPSKTVSS